MQGLPEDSVALAYRYEVFLPERCISIPVENQSVREKLEEILPDLTAAEAIVLKAPTGSGKSTVCMEVLIRLAKEIGVNILFVTNRTGVKEALKRKYLKGIQSDDLKKLTPLGLEEKIIFGNVGFINYQKPPSFIFNSEHDEWRRNLGFVIFDECHFFTADSLFNENCERILKYATSYFCKAIRIYLTATDEDVLAPLVDAETNNYFSLSCSVLGRRTLTRYTFPADYSRYQLNFFDETEDLIRKINESGKEKWLIFVSNKEKGRDLLNALSDNIAEYIDADSKGSEAWLNLITNERFEKQVLITTSVLDCGMNIHDDDVKNIAIFTENKTNFIQCIGRKRLKPKEKVNLWVHNLKTKHITGKIHQYEVLLDWFQKYDECTYDDRMAKLKRELWNAEDIVRKNLFTFKHDKIYPKDTARFYLERQVYTLSKMLEDGNSFKKTVASWLGKELDFEKNRKNLQNFCNKNLLKAIFNEDFDKFRNLVVAAYKEAGFKEAQISRNGSMKTNALNTRLQELKMPFRIQKNSLDSISDSQSKDYWIIYETPAQ